MTLKNSLAIYSHQFQEDRMKGGQLRSSTTYSEKNVKKYARTKKTCMSQKPIVSGTVPRAYRVALIYVLVLNNKKNKIKRFMSVSRCASSESVADGFWSSS